ncbi:MAG: translation initiation factor IF-3 [Patescibacteria group bacterium]
MNRFVKINNQITASELRVLGPDGKNMGVLPFAEALQTAQKLGVDLIEISSVARPPLAKIMDYGKFQYEQKKKLNVTKVKTQKTETKVIQIKIGTGEHDLNLKANKISKWLEGGNRVKLDLFLIGRTKYMKFDFLRERIERVLRLVSVQYKVADGPKKSPKGLSVVLEKQK